jgi:hypothetical protein
VACRLEGAVVPRAFFVPDPARQFDVLDLTLA